jgi:hypothetical protein
MMTRVEGRTKKRTLKKTMTRQTWRKRGRNPVAHTKKMKVVGYIVIRPPTQSLISEGTP